MPNINVTVTSSFLSALSARSTAVHSGNPVVSRQDAAEAASSLGLAFPRWFANGPQFKAYADARGQFRVPTIAECESLGLGYGEPGKRGRKPGATVVRQSKPRVPKPVAVSVNLAQPAKVDVASLVRDDKANTDIQTAVSKALGVDVLLGSSDNIPYVPQVAKTYVPWGHFTDLKTLVESQHFLPTMIVGPSGNGKTDMCEQVCAHLQREYVRVNITSQTDEDDLLGGFRLVNGETKFALGPIPLAMLRGAVVNLDEIDLGGSALMCLQPVLEGKPLYLKKIGRYINPAPGFNVVATANTKGRGSDDGKYIGTNLLNEAFLERFNFTIEQQYPAVAVEKKILTKTYQALGGEITDEISVFFETLAKWADAIRQTFAEDGIEDIISTRRLVHIVKTYQIFGDQERAMSLCLNRFDVSVKAKFLDFYDKLKPQPVVESPVVESPVAPDADIPF